MKGIEAMESANVCETIFGLEKNQFDEENVATPSEITVAITLREYRELVEGNATAEMRIKITEQDKRSMLEEIKSLKEENARLKADTDEITREEREFTTGGKVAFYRKQKGVSQKELAQKLGMTNSMLSMYEKGKYNLSPQLLVRIAGHLALSDKQKRNLMGEWI